MPGAKQMRDKAKKAAAQRRYAMRRKRQDPSWKVAYNNDYFLRNRNRCQFVVARCHAKRRGLEFTIRFEEIVWPEFCPVFGVRLVRAAVKGPTSWSPSLDRIDNTKGYVPGNVIVVSLKANRMKSDATISELKRLVEFYEKL